VSFASVAGSLARALVVLVWMVLLLPGAGWAQSFVPPFYEITVTPDNGTAPLRAPNTGPYVASFTLENTGGLDDTFALSCAATGTVSCVSVNLGNQFLAGGQQIAVNVSYTVGATGTGTVTLWAEGHSVDDGKYNVTAGTAPIVALVAPVLTSGSRAVVRTRQPLIRALFTRAAGGSPIDTALTTLTWAGQSVTALARANRGVVEWEVDSTRWLAVGDSAAVSVKACALPTLCTTVTRWIVLPNDQAPVLGFTGAPLAALGAQFSAPFGPGLSVSGAEVETGFSTVPFFSFGGRARSLGLSYSTRQSYPRALVPVDLELPWPAGTPDQIKLVLVDGAVRMDSLVLASPTCATGALKRCRSVLQADFAASTFSAPTRKWLTVEASVTSGGVTKMASDSVEVVLVDRRSTPYGSGWWPSLGLKLVAAGSDRVLVGPTGTATIFRGNGDSLYLAQPGSFTVLKRVGSGWQLSQRGSTAYLAFDSQGRLASVVEPTGTTDVSIAYSGTTDQMTTVTYYPGKQIALGYVSGKLRTLTDEGGRVTRVTINGTNNRLTYDSLSSPAARPNTTQYIYRDYPGTNTVVLIKRIGTILDTTIVKYDSAFRRRPESVRLPRVEDESGVITPSIDYYAYERQGVGGLRSLDSVYVEIKDPRGNWTRSLLNRWGQARKTWDALGTLSRTEYRPDGLVLWTEGKVADSSRVYHTYDALNRLAKSYLVRAAGDTLRLDSLVYDASHRVIRQIDSRGKIDSLTYDAFGQLTKVVNKAGHTARTWYNAEGLVDSAQAPNATKRRTFTYEATWKNVAKAVDEDSTTFATTFYDALGRPAEGRRKIRVQIVSGASEFQWRRDTTFYNDAGQVDSLLRQRSKQCVDPCTTPFWFPLSSAEGRVRYVRDRAGRDSLRLNDIGKATMYVYDRLGRLVSRRPWTDSMAVKDSTVYDAAGNVSKRITRRGDVITAQFDSRNRTTTTVVPGVGTLTLTYAGHADQLTRMHVASPVDSIGGVTQELRWGYDRRGRLKADTAYTGSTARGTSYGYDTHERPSTMNDPLGTWTTGYEADRGLANTLLTPFADTLKYTWNGRGLPIAQVMVSSGPGQGRTTGWSQAGALETMLTSVGGGTPYYPGYYHRLEADLADDPVSLVPVFEEIRGSGGTVVTWQDSVTYDGWERVQKWVALKNGAAIASETVGYDASGNVSAGESEVHDATTNRLLSRSVGGHTYRYAYDRSGNLVEMRDSTHAGGAVAVWVYGYTALDQLRSVRRSGVVIARYGYDVQGRRIAKRVYSAASGGTVAYTRFVYHGGQVAFEADSSGGIGLRYTWGAGTDNLVGIRDAAGNQYYTVQDKLGSMRGLVKRDGTWVLSLTYRPWGGVLDSAGTQHALLRYRWTGREFDAETGLYFHRSRYYSPAARRFVQEDAIGYSGGDNLYSYVGGQVLEGIDPDGLMYRSLRGGGGGGGPRNDGGNRFSGMASRFEISFDFGGFLILDVYIDGLWAGTTYDDGHFGYQYSLDPNLHTGDKNMDNAKYRQWMDDNLAAAPEDVRNPGYIVEVGGWCSKRGCSRVVGEVGRIDIGPQPKGALFAYHSHPNVGMPALGGGGVYAAFPSQGDFTPYDRAGRSVNTYIFSPEQIARVYTDGRSYRFDPNLDVFDRWE
jgi:RHS repeat-associated protein